jgi:hypothetical protein
MRAVLFTVVSGAEQVTTRIEAISLDTRQRHVIVEDGRYPLHSTSGHLLFLRNEGLLAVPLDTSRLETTGPAAAILDDVGLEQTGAPLVTISSVGALAYIPRYEILPG